MALAVTTFGMIALMSSFFLKLGVVELDGVPQPDEHSQQARHLLNEMVEKDQWCH
jgi:hypothetical protein